MKVNAVNLSYSKMHLKSTKQYQKSETQPVTEKSADSVSFKGLKNAARAGSLSALGGAFVGLLFAPGLGVLAGAATMAGIVGAVGAVAGLMHSDKHNIFKQ